jgi:hypothetical protein
VGRGAAPIKRIESRWKKVSLPKKNSSEFSLFVELTNAVPTTLAGAVALLTHLGEVNKTDPWKFEDNFATPVIGALATAFNHIKGVA